MVSDANRPLLRHNDHYKIHPIFCKVLVKFSDPSPGVLDQLRKSESRKAGRKETQSAPPVHSLVHGCYKIAYV